MRRLRNLVQCVAVPQNEIPFLLGTLTLRGAAGAESATVDRIAFKRALATLDHAPNAAAAAGDSLSPSESAPSTSYPTSDLIVKPKLRRDDAVATYEELKARLEGGEGDHSLAREGSKAQRRIELNLKGPLFAGSRNLNELAKKIILDETLVKDAIKGFVDFVYKVRTGGR